MTVSLEARFEAAPDVHARPFHDEVIVLDLVGGEYFSLDEVGARVWAGLVAGESVEEVVAGLQRDYAADVERIEADVVALVEELVLHRLLVGKRA